MVLDHLLDLVDRGHANGGDDAIDGAGLGAGVEGQGSAAAQGAALDVLAQLGGGRYLEVVRFGERLGASQGADAKEVSREAVNDKLVRRRGQGGRL